MLDKKLYNFILINKDFFSLILLIFLLTFTLIILTPGDSNPQEYYYYVRTEDNLNSIAQLFNISVTDLKQINQLESEELSPGQKLIIKKPNLDSYLVQAGDTLTKIAHKFQVNRLNLMAVNNLDSDYILVDQKLLIPNEIGNPQGTPRNESQVNTVNYNQEKVNSNLTIVIDPGHGGNDPGAVSYTSSGIVRETDLVLDIAQQLTVLLKSSGFNPILTRNSDYSLSLEQRIQIAKQNQADLFVSIHVDSNPNYPQTSGSNVYIQNKADSYTYQLAYYVQKHLETITARPSNMLGPVVRNNFRVLMQTRPSILIETGFLSNYSDLKNLQKPEFRYKVAKGIYKGIKEWAS